MASPDQKKMQASWEHLQAREKEFKVKEDELKRLVGSARGAQCFRFVR
jgi:hypothetical protein